MITAEQLRELLSYDPATGVFVWLVSPALNVHAGSVAGGINDNGYRLITIFGRRYRAQRLAWFYMTGEWPADEIDHHNRIRDDNSWRNLREATNRQNHQNTSRPSTNTSGLKGASFHKSRGRWRATIKANGKYHHLGYFDTAEEAHAAYVAAAERFFGQFARAA